MNRVRYTGGATVRRITEGQWEQANVKGQKTVEWNRANKYSVDISDLTDEAISVLESEPGFRVDRAATNVKSKSKAD
jgi:hypothetical protein